MSLAFASSSSAHFQRTEYQTERIFKESIMSDFHPMKAPDYGMQTWGEGMKTGKVQMFTDPNKQPDYVSEYSG